MSKNTKPQEIVIAVAKKQVGYLGKKSNAHLNDFKANAGGKFNQYASDLDALGDFYNGRKNGYDWCDVFVDWCFVAAFGRELGQKLLEQPDRSLGAGTAYSLGYYKKKGRLFTNPEPADQIFFGDAKSTWHTGLVVKVADGYVYTVEGNAGSPSAVRECKYKMGNKTIKGYGRPDWSLCGNIYEEDDDNMTELEVRKICKQVIEEARKDLQDNDCGVWSQQARDWAIGTGLITGGGTMPDGTPNYMWADQLTREQAAALFFRFAQMMGKV